MAKDHLDDYELFYQEIPTSQDYLQETEIEDLVDTDTTTTTKGLNADQVSMLAQDALTSNRKDIKRKTSKSDDVTNQNDESTQTMF